MTIGANWAEIWSPVWKAVWTQTPATPAVSVPAPSGGFFFDFDRHSAQRRQRLRELAEAEEHEQEIKDEIDRNIAKLLHEQQRKDEERKDLERIRSLVIQHKHESPEIDSERVLKALNEARLKQSRANLERLQREMDRMFEEEEDFLALMMLALQ